MTANQLDPQNVTALCNLMKDYLQGAAFLETLPAGHGFALARETFERSNSITIDAIAEVANQLGLDDNLDDLWKLAQRAVDADTDFRKAIILASPTERQRIASLIEARKDADLFDANGIPCHFDREGYKTWN